MSDADANPLSGRAFLAILMKNRCLTSQGCYYYLLLFFVI